MKQHYAESSKKGMLMIGYILVSNWLLEHVIGAKADGQIK
jgi:hypothetical protein